MPIADEFTLRVKRFRPRDRRLGRHVVHHSKSLRYLAHAADPRTLLSAQHRINIGMMDQENVGSCTGHAGMNMLAADAFWSAGKAALAGGEPHAYAVGLYSAATVLDPWPGQYMPDDTGSDGLSIAKVLLARGLISGYLHAISLDATLTALAERPVMVGTNWTRDMFSPAPDGRLSITGPVEGGHEYILDELDVEHEIAWMRNQWGSNWGISGRAWMSWADLGRLLAADGDCTILVPRTEPAPVPTPEPPPKHRAEEAFLAEALTRYMRTREPPDYVRKRTVDWLAAISKE